MNTTWLSCTSGPVMANGPRHGFVVLMVQVGKTGRLIFVRFPRVRFLFGFFVLFCSVLFFSLFGFVLLLL